jgi:anti-sigma factor RsiW
MKQRDIELLSSYLDGQLSSADSTRLEARLRTDPALRSVLSDLRGARSLLRQLPMRKAPRNFTLTPQMVGKNPPLPRSYPVFRFAATLATIMLFFTFGLNIMGRQMASQPPAYGMGGGGAPDTFAAESATELQAAAAPTEAPATEAPAAEEPSVAMEPMSTATVVGEDAAKAMDTAVVTEDEENAANSGVVQEPPPVAAEPAPVGVVSSVWQWLLAGVAVISLFVIALMRQLATSRWRSKS